MTTVDTTYRIHAPYPEWLVRGQANELEARIYDASGDLTAPASGTVSVFDDSNVKIVDAAAVVIAGSVATYTVAADDLPSSLDIGDGWRIEWDLVFGSNPSQKFVRAASLVRSFLYPTVVTADLQARHQNLSRLIATGNDADDFVTTAWEVIVRMLLKAGRLPWLVLSPYALHDSLVFKSLELIFRDGHAAAGDGKYSELADYYSEAFATEWSTISFDYDFNEDGQIDSDEKAGTEAVIYTGGPGVETSRGATWLP
jgi:hypothetical protein